MSHKTQYKTCSNTDLSILETEVNNYIKDLHKNEDHEDIKVHDITTLFAGNVFIAAITATYTKKKKPVAEVITPMD
jgi:hypothetical protein